MFLEKGQQNLPKMPKIHLKNTTKLYTILNIFPISNLEDKLNIVPPKLLKYSIWNQIHQYLDNDHIILVTHVVLIAVMYYFTL